MASSPLVRETKDFEPPTARKEVDDNNNAGGSQDDDDDNTSRKLSMLEEDVTFLADDSTEEIPHPASHFFVTQDGVRVESVNFTSLPHPRSGKINSFAVAGVKDGDKTVPTLLEVQKHRPQFCTFFYGNSVEPSSPLTLLLPIDLAFFALRLASTEGSRVKTSFVSFDDILDEGFQGNARACLGTLPEDLLKQLQAALRLVCDTQQFGDDLYFRYNTERTKAWFEVKVNMMMKSQYAKQLLLGIYPSTTASSSSGEGQQQQQDGEQEVDTALLKEKSVRMLLEYTPSYLHAELKSAVGAGTAAKKVVTGGGASADHWERGKRDRDDEDDIIVKPKAKDDRSANAKRLAKAGPPKGTRSIMNFFKKKEPKKPE